ncbi:YD repeat protein [[Leptolyngbya] sp. PCC 7376]|uniref:toll/interleukin-1 receptor domain-containing protein n=1 Tax=[Leptolyngbya] sp. PCC 7376 TaxID=111781 RepID=UPI00029EF51A|nr:TIR domain-containing protein [[Leptolyngbya] sp. PCC 7376]AFY40426.1 YD repeat protein [[Leptolyngbya] sp. PCC 7376]
MSNTVSPSASKSFKNAFISYGRADSLDFAKWLNDKLVDQGYDIWFDFENIPQGVDYQKQIDAGIENADNFIFVIAPHATNSPYCRKEVELAIALNKRLVPIMHVEEISRETWQGRNPNGTDEQWEAYKTEGLHSCFTNLHPELGKINWNQVSFKEGVNDYEQSFQALVDIFERQSNYVRQHTEFLDGALKWERGQKQSQLLLDEEQTLRAQHWLQTKFHGEQPPCVPTDLHCEFITESLKRLPNGMSQLFFAHANSDTETMQSLRQQMRRAGYSVWTPEADIQSGQDVQAEILRGIEGADSFIYLMSSQSLESSDCQSQLQYAQTLKKRIIPIRLESIGSDTLPANQQKFSWIDCTSDEAASKQLAIAQVLKAIKEESSFYEQHRQILVKALSWDRQKRPKSLLLQGQDFTLAEQWLALSKTEQSSRATDLQQIYIKASQEMNQFFDVFISYGRADSKDFATILHDRLVEQGFNVWFDQNDIPLGVDFQEQINAGIEKAHNFLFIIAPHSVNSPYCGKEVDLALDLNKRIIPILHVEEISKETWQQRNPYKTEESDWEEAQKQGAHSSFNNMNPEIGKINWVYCREQDDFEASFEGLMTLCRQHEDYVKQHTEILAKALSWESHQKQSQYLLVGENRIEAEKWLLTRFTETQAPCFPTDLHCEYITESIKNANNLMTQVFLSHSDEDQEIEDKVRRSLMREGYTVWSSQRDIEAGVDFNAAINRGIETTDNIVYLLSPNSLASEYCQKEIDYALSLNKRIIPLNIAAVDETNLPAAIQSLQYIDLTNGIEDETYQARLNELLKILNQDKAYFEEHKAILVRGLKWQAQQKNNSILLRGHNLREAEAWLKLAAKRSEYAATPLHQEFIQASLDQLEDVALDVFVSYSRSDSDFVRQLNDALQVQGKTTWFDQENIASGTDFQAEIFQGIETCDNFLFVISPNSVNSPYCAGEVEHAAKLGKRFVTVLHQSVSSASLHPELEKVQWIDFNKNDGDFYANFSELIRTLDTDREHVRSHTKWSQRALDWVNKKRGKDLLLRGNEFAIAENWLKEADDGKKTPKPTTLQRDFLIASKEAIEAAIRREKRISMIIRTLLGVVSVACVIAFIQYRQANFQRKRAERVQEGQINALSDYSVSLLENHQDLQSLIEAIRAGRQLQLQLKTVDQSTVDAVTTTLRDALLNIEEVNRITGHPSAQGINAVAYSPDESMVATGGADGNIRLWSAEGESIRTLEDHEAPIYEMEFSPNGKFLLSGSEDFTARLWDPETGELLRTFEDHDNSIYGVSFSPDSQIIATASVDGTVNIYSVEGQLLQTLEIDLENYDVSFNADGSAIATASEDGILRFWDLEGELRNEVEAHENGISTVAFSPKGDLVATGSWDQTAKLWTIDGESVVTLQGHTDEVNHLFFSDDGEFLVTTSYDNLAKVWSREGELLHTIRGHEDGVLGVAISKDSSTVKTTSLDGTARVWDISSLPNVKTFEDQTADIFEVEFSPDEKWIGSAGDSGARIWDLEGNLISDLDGENNAMRDLAFSQDGRYLATGEENGVVKIWEWTGDNFKLVQTVQNEDAGKMRAIAFHPEGKYLATAGDGVTVQLWTLDGESVFVSEVADWTNSIAFSPDGEFLISGGWDQMISLWDLEGNLLNSWEAHPDSINGLAFGNDAQTIISASNDQTAQIWQLDGASGSPTLTVNHGAEVNKATLSPDGKNLITVGGQTVKFWDLEGRLLQTIAAHNDIIYGFALSSDGKQFVTGSYDSTARLWSYQPKVSEKATEIWQLDLNALVDHACGVARNYLTFNPDVSDSDRLLCEPDL